MKCKDFTYWMPTKLHFSINEFTNIGNYIKGNNIFVIISKSVYKSGLMENFLKIVQEKKVAFFCDVEPNPTIECVAHAVRLARDLNATTVIGIGGGSCLDVSKAVACFVDNEEDVVAYMSTNIKAMPCKGCNTILVPTTAGTGSEVTNVGVYTNLVKNEKIPIVSNNFWADDAILDPSLCITMPKKVVANTGMDALCHALESYWNKNSNIVSDVLAQEAIALILNNIKISYDCAEDMEAKSNMLEASLLAGIAFAQTRTTAAHALSYPISMLYHISHGEACALSIPPLIRLSIEKEENKMKHLAKHVGFHSLDSFADEVEELLTYLHMPTKLSQLNGSKKDIEQIVKASLSYRGQLDLTPVTLDEDAIKQLLMSIY